jgi:hypothetical protein
MKNVFLIVALYSKMDEVCKQRIPGYIKIKDTQWRESGTSISVLLITKLK